MGSAEDDGVGSWVVGSAVGSGAWLVVGELMGDVGSLVGEGLGSVEPEGDGAVEPVGEPGGDSLGGVSAGPSVAAPVGVGDGVGGVGTGGASPRIAKISALKPSSCAEISASV